MYRSVRALAAATAAVVCACSAKDSARTDSGKVAQAGASVPAPSASHASFDGATHTAVIHAKDFAFDAPDSITAGWTTFHLVNDGPALHHVQIVRLDSGKTAADLGQAMKNPGPPPRWAVFVGGPNAPDPNGQSETVLDMTPGSYVLLCLVDIGDGVPHMAKGMVRPLTVTATGTPSTEPTADVTVSLADYNFAVQGALASGAHTIKVVNAGPQPHELEIIKLAPGKRAADMLGWVEKPAGPPPGDAIGGAVAILPGLTNYIKANLTPGNYAFVCFLPDGKDGKRHYVHGMVKEITVS